MRRLQLRWVLLDVLYSNGMVSFKTYVPRVVVESRFGCPYPFDVEEFNVKKSRIVDDFPNVEVVVKRRPKNSRSLILAQFLRAEARMAREFPDLYLSAVLGWSSR